MRKPYLALFVFITTLLSSNVFAFSIKKKAISNQGIFGIEVAGSDVSFYGRADQILSVSFQEYVVTGAGIVSEVVIDFRGSNQLLRIYNVRPPGTADVSERANRMSAANSENRGLDPSAATKLPVPSQIQALESKVTNITSAGTAGLVVKTYPTTTHAKTVEMMVSSKSELLSFYKSFQSLYCGTAVSATPGSTVDPSDPTSEVQKVSQIGGNLFTIQ